MQAQEYLKQCVELAHENVLTDNGGPFAALVVRDGQIVATGRNEVTKNNDPTAHAEVQAIRAACCHLNTFQLSDCELYTSCEPCPMCIGAIYWARFKAVYFAATKEDAARYGFDDRYIYEQMALPVEKRQIRMVRLQVEGLMKPFEAWEASEKKKPY